ncbi:TonB-dependent receptor plug [Fibrella aestuarina BUZ 2]|uniref:TonB-dependent receptor plug n=1 Tax=Fibrella aestuarina BUZ 2 TaxID=1166018 RepID=I0K8S8_9BACT|nr:TonB-dependent receptor [Fibrella aestuarina]CCH00531.1 TonB-dependent receptor plug [Fibrella aestuarina BUZ 2]
MKTRLLVAWLGCLWVSGAYSQSKSTLNVPTVTISGYVREAGSQEALIGVNVYQSNDPTDRSRPDRSRPDRTRPGTTTNTYGFYSLTVPAQDSLQLTYSMVGYAVEQPRIGAQKSQTVNVFLVAGKQLSEVVVRSSRADEKVSETAQMSQIELPIAQIKKVPALLGEKDVLKVLQLMPGVQKGSEGQSGLYVRGGGPDQNLIVLDDAVVYNASHLFGFFSVFNGDALKSVELTKGGFPARYGGRLSSVIDLNMKDGNKEKLHGEGGIGLIASRLTLEGPLTKKKSGPGSTSFLLSGRRTYLDVIAAPLIAAESNGRNTAGYYFYDLNAKVNTELGPKDKLYLSGYFGRDKFYAIDKSSNSNSKSDIGLGWGNATGTLRWNHLFSDKVFGNASFIYSNYDFSISSDETTTSQQSVDEFSLRYTSGIRDLGAKYDLDIYPNPQHSIRVGVQATAHQFTPSAIVVKNTDIKENRRDVETIDVTEAGVYAEDTWKPTDAWRVNAGLRLSAFVHKAVTYLRPEPRLSVAYIIKPDLSVKASYALMNQYVHLLSNTGIGLPTDLWVPTTDRIRPQQSQQWAVGLAKDFSERGLTLTIEGYYKRMDNIVNYKEGASFLLIEDPTRADRVRWEDNVTAGRGWSYGAEVLLQKKVGRFSGWIGYTWSRTEWQFADLNNGEPFFPRYDRRHDASLVGIYELSPRVTLAGTWVYGTGQALTLPQISYNAFEQGNPYLTNLGYNNNLPLINQLFGFPRQVDEYGPKNSFRAEAYHRFDVSVQFHKKKKRHERTWEFSAYNAYNRRNPFFYTLTSRPVDGPSNTSETVLQRYSVFPIVPSVSYNFKF